MKALIALIALSLSTQAVFATNYRFDCGESFNIPRWAVVKSKAPGEDGFTLSAKYSTIGKDETTGATVAKTYDMVGQTDYSSELTGQEIPVIALSKVGDENYQVVIAKTEVVDEIVPAMQIDLTNSEVLKFICVLKKFKK